MYDTEPSPSIEERAWRSAGEAQYLLKSPDHLYVGQEYHTYGGDNIAVRLRSQVSAHAAAEDSLPLQYLYLRRQGSMQPIDFSLDISALSRAGVVQGMAENYGLMAETRRLLRPGTPERELADIASEAVRLHWLGESALRPEEDSNKSVLTDAFEHAVGQGAMRAYRSTARHLPDGSRLEIENVRTEGDVRHFGDYQQPDTILRVAVGMPNEDTQAVLSIDASGLLETHIDIADPLRRAAYYARREDILRDATGAIMMVDGSDNDKLVILAAERAIGARRLRGAILNRIEAAIAQL